jgi:hypothetical protein
MGDQVWILEGAKWPFVMRQERTGTMVILAPAMVYTSQDWTVSEVMFGRDWLEEWERERIYVG